MSELSELLERFRVGADVVEAAAAGAEGEELDYRPAPHKWSVRQIAAHLADTECLAVLRLRQVIAEDNPPLPSIDQHAWAERTNYAGRELAQSLATFRTLRAENYALLKDTPAEAFQRTGQHAVRGPMTLLDLLRIFATHPEKHAAQMGAARDAYKTRN